MDEVQVWMQRKPVSLIYIHNQWLDVVDTINDEDA